MGARVNRQSVGFLLVEAVLIVVSILLAFWIDAWWDGRQQESRRIELLQALRADFSATSVLLDDAVATAMSDAGRTGGYLEVVVDDLDVSRDSLLYLLDGVGAITFFEPSIASYRSAVSGGALDLIRNPQVLETLSDFELALDNYEQHLELSGELFYLGAVHDLRVAMGGYMAPQRGRVAITDDEHRHVFSDDFDLRSPVAVAAAEAVYWAHVNIADSLIRMGEAAERLVELIDAGP